MTIQAGLAALGDAELYALYLTMAGEAFAKKKKKGPGRGWWGPPKGTHGTKGREGAIAPDVNDMDRIAIINGLGGVPDEHLKGVTITTSTPKGWQTTNKGMFFEPGRSRGGGHPGAYFKQTQTLHVSSEALQRLGSRTLIHEIGHHVTRTSVGWKQMARDHVLSALPGTSEGLAKMGLRKYSTTRGSDYLADAYVVWARGSKSQWDTLRAHAKKHGGESYDLERLFGPKRG